MFGFFKKKPKLPAVTDKIWMTNKAKWEGLLKDIKTAKKTPKADPFIENSHKDILDADFDKWNKSKAPDNIVCVLYYFEESYKELLVLLEQHNLATTALEKLSMQAPSDELLVVTINAMELGHSIRLQNKLRESIDIEQSVCMFVERHPLFSQENSLMEKMASLTNGTLNVRFYASLEDPIMKVFGGDRITELMNKMGVKEEEAIEHSMISKAINNAQKQLDSKVKNPQKAASAKEWFERNVKG